MIFMFLTPNFMNEIIDDHDYDFGDHCTTSF